MKTRTGKKDELEERPILGRLALHSFQLGFKDIDGRTIELEAELPKDMRATLQQLRKRKKPLSPKGGL